MIISILPLSIGELQQRSILDVGVSCCLITAPYISTRYWHSTDIPSSTPSADSYTFYSILYGSLALQPRRTLPGLLYISNPPGSLAFGYQPGGDIRLPTQPSNCLRSFFPYIHTSPLDDSNHSKIPATPAGMYNAVFLLLASHISQPRDFIPKRYLRPANHSGYTQPGATTSAQLSSCISRRLRAVDDAFDTNTRIERARILTSSTSLTLIPKCNSALG